MIGVDHQQRERRLLPHGAPPLAVDLVVELAAVTQTGECVGDGELLELGLGSRAAADLARQEQRDAEHEQDQPGHDRDDPHDLAVPETEHRFERLADHDVERA